MLSDLFKLKIQGGIFGSPTVLNFFESAEKNKITKATLLYGRNGEGKSTIAKAFRCLSGEGISALNSVIALNNSDNEIQLDDEDKKHIFVFDEQYVDKNVRLQTDHLDTIVMFGEAADLTQKIEDATKELKSAKLTYEQLEQSFNTSYENSETPTSPRYYINHMREALKGDDNWAGRNRVINKQRRNAQVNDDSYKKFICLTPTKAKTELFNEYQEELKNLEIVQSGKSIIDVAVPNLPDSYKKINDENIIKLLSIKLEKPELSDREKKLLSLLEEGEHQKLKQQLVFFQNTEVSECPYCFQQISPEQRKSVVLSITKVLSTLVEDHQRSLNSNLIETIHMDLSRYEKLSNYQQCLDSLDNLNLAITNYHNYLTQKINNPYEPIIANNESASQLVGQVIKSLEDLEKERNEYNSSIQQDKPIIDKLNRINNEIAYYDVINSYRQYEKQNDAMLIAKRQLDQAKNDFEVKKKSLESLDAERKNVHLAVDELNACMKYIFFSEDRLTIKYHQGKYILLSHGNSVKPCDISVGERNIIGLSYFFTSILKDKDERDAYAEEYLLVIDDPVSSYDLENRIGIFSFLKYKLGMFLEANINSRALVLTHDLRAFYDIHKIFEEIIGSTKRRYPDKKIIFNQQELKDRKLWSFSYKKRQEYTQLVDKIYRFAKGENAQDDLVIGNIMRQVLEAFSTFLYKKGIEEVSSDDDILSLLDSQEYVLYFKNLMYRLVLHGGSHREEEVKTMNDFHFFSLISEEQKKQTAQDVLCFIYLLNKKHLQCHLINAKEATQELDSWCENIKTRHRQSK